ncbi:MAG: BatA domain-containing protein, partial [Gaiellaceae bacterium]
MSFGAPYLFLSLLAVPLAIVLWRMAERRRMRYAVRYTNVEILAGIAGGRQLRRYLPAGLFLVALATLCVGLARPHVRTLVPNDNATVVLVLDVSGSMQANDVKPTRLAAAQKAMNSFLDRVP